MLTVKAVRSQVDGKQAEYSLASGLDCSGDVDRTRQEDAHDADINNILKRFGLGMPLNQKQYQIGDTDYDIDLQTAFNTLADARAAWTDLPLELREKYPTWKHFLSAIDRGEIRDITEKPVEKKKSEPESDPEPTRNEPLKRSKDPQDRSE